MTTVRFRFDPSFQAALDSISASSRAAMDRMSDELMLAAMTRPGASVTSTVNRQTETITIEHINRMLDEMPPRVTFVSSQCFPADQAIRIETPREHLLLAGPEFWTRAAVACKGEGLDILKVFDMDAAGGDIWERERERICQVMAAGGTS